jgi:hypothetical protein
MPEGLIRFRPLSSPFQVAIRPPGKLPDAAQTGAIGVELLSILQRRGGQYQDQGDRTAPSELGGVGFLLALPIDVLNEHSRMCPSFVNV